MIRALPLFLLVGCGSGEWVTTVWGEEYPRDGIPADVFADGCSVAYTAFDVQVQEAALLDGDGAVETQLPGALFDLASGEEQELGRGEAGATFYDTARFRIGPSDGPSVHAAGEVSCAGGTVAFDWEFATDTTYLCEPEALTIPAGGEATTQLTVHADHLFYDGLENADAAIRGEAIVAADADQDGMATLDELSAVAVAPLGYAVGQYSEVENLGDFVTFLTRTLGHVNGEGHCQVDL